MRPYEPSGGLLDEAKKLPKDVVARQYHDAGIRDAEPVMVAMDSLYRYAERHGKKYESKLADDGVLGPAWLDAIKGVRALLNGDGAFDGGTLEGLFWRALRVAGFKEEDL